MASGRASPTRTRATVVAVDEPNRLEVTHFSPLTGQEDVPENYHTLVYALDADEEGTKVTITQDNNGDQDEADRNAATWGQMLESLKGHLAAAEARRFVRDCRSAGRARIVA